MVELPVELFDIIASFSRTSDLPRLSTVSRAWQSTVERFTMREIHIKSTDLQDFSNVFVHPNRRAALINLSYDVVLPAYSERQCARFETGQDKQRNNETLTDAVHSLFSLLHSWDKKARIQSDGTLGYERAEAAGRILLTLDAHSPLDPDRREHVDVRAQRLETLLPNGRKDLFEHRYERSFLRILRCEELSAVPRIRGFEVKKLCHRRRIEGASLAGVAAKLPNLDTIVWAINDDEKFHEAVRQQNRFDFAESLATLPLQSLKRVDLTIFNRAPHNQYFKLPSALLPSAPSTDHLSLSLHALSLSPNLTHLRLRGEIVLSPCFFWPQNPTTTTPIWPHLQYLDVFLNITTPEGNWLYVRDPEGSDDDDDEDEDDDVEPLTVSDLLELADFLGIENENETVSKQSNDSELPHRFSWFLQSRLDGSIPERYFRKKVDVERLNPMLMAMARAARQMPAIRRLGLRLHQYSFSEVDVYFLARGGQPGGVIPEWFEANAGGEEEEGMARTTKQWVIMIGEEAKWSVPNKLKAAWKSVGAEDGDEVLIEIEYTQ